MQHQADVLFRYAPILAFAPFNFLVVDRSTEPLQDAQCGHACREPSHLSVHPVRLAWLPSEQFLSALADTIK